MSNNIPYIITIDPGSWSKKELTKFHKNITEELWTENWWHYLESTYIILVNHEISARKLSDYISTVAPNKFFFVSKLNLSDFNGWLNNEAWEWLDKVKNDIY